MIISHKYRFIFLKTTKTAGTSVEIALSRFCGPEDIITPISPVDEELRRNLGYRTAQNVMVPFSRYSLRNWADALVHMKRFRFHNHIAAREVRRIIGNRIWDSYYKFCFERNPWDRFISLYYWRCRQDPRPSISDFIASGALDRMKRNGFGVYTINGKIAVDKIYLYEERETALEDIYIRLGLPERMSLPKAKGGFRPDRRSYHEILTDEEKNRIAEKFADEISLFGYQG